MSRKGLPDVTRFIQALIGMGEKVADAPASIEKALVADQTTESIRRPRAHQEQGEEVTCDAEGRRISCRTARRRYGMNMMRHVETGLAMGVAVALPAAHAVKNCHHSERYGVHGQGRL